MKYPICKLSSIVNPGTYMVLTTDKEHASEVENLEKSMTKEMAFYDTSGIELKAKMCVAVKGKDNRGILTRGIIENKVANDIYEVLLVDYGKIVRAHKSSIIIITNKNFITVEPLAFMVKLYGIIPARYYSFGDERKPRACKEWGEESQKFVEDFFKYNSEVIVQSILIQQRTVYGDLFIKDKSKDKYVSLRKLLCKNKFCAYSVSVFIEHGFISERANDAGESEEMKTKMEMVKKWQNENFGKFERNTYQLPLPASSPLFDSISDVTSLNPSECKTSPSQRIDSARREEDSATFTEKRGSGGLGRGSLKFMLAETMDKKTLSQSSGPSTYESNSSDKTEIEASRLCRGRGLYLRKVLEMIKTRTLETSETSDVTASSAETDSSKDSESVTHKGVRNIPAGSSDIRNDPPSVSRVQRAVVKPGEFLELSDSNEMSEVSLSIEEDLAPPPLVRNGTKISNLDTSEFNGKESFCKTENEKVDQIEKSLGKLEMLDCNKKQKIDLKCWKLNGNESWCSKTNHQSNLTLLNNCWTPFVLFDDSIVESISNFRELPIQPSILKNLERRGTFKTLSQVQRWAIPAIRKQHNTLLISGSKTGKTLSYLIPLMDYVQDEFYFEELPLGNGPCVVIVASSSYACESIYYTCHYLLGHMSEADAKKSKIKVVLGHGSGREKEIWVTLTNGCDVLICTPPCLVRLLEFPVLTNFERLACLVLDEIDIICEDPFRKSVRIILEMAQLSTKGRHYQKILCGEKWTPNVEKIVNVYVKSYALVMGSYLEAVIYKRLKPSIFLVDKHRKAEILFEVLKNNEYKSKIVIFCETTAEAIFISSFLTEKGITPLLTHEKILAEKLKESERLWKNSKKSVLIITDGVLCDLNIRDAQVLIHYGLPSKSKTNFYLRYSTVLSSYQRNRNFQKTEAQRLSEQVHTAILVDDHNHYQLPHIVEFVSRLGEKLPQTIIDRCQDIRRMTEVGKRTSPICGNLLAFGRCRYSTSCSGRHAMLKACDFPLNLPTAGWVNFAVVKIHDASLLSARLLEHIDLDGNSTKFDDRRHVDISSKLAEYFKENNNRRSLGHVNVGCVCGVAEMVKGKEIFYRAKVVEYLRMDKYDTPLEVSVKLLDEGDIWRQKSAELYELPADLSQLLPTAVDLRLVGVQPKDFDVSWSQVANAFFEHLMIQTPQPSQYWSGKIVFALNNTLFLNPVKRKQFLPQLNIHVFDMVVQNEMVNQQIAVPNSEHLPALVKLAEEAGMELVKAKETRKDDVKVEPQWAFFDSDVIEVKFSAAEKTSVVFLQAKKYEKLLEVLERDCQTEGEETERKMRVSREKKLDAAVSTCAVGGFCLARFEDGKWNRGRIEAEKDNEFYVFFVDHGDFLSVPKENVVPISKSLLLRLPCQAIECSLVGIEEQEECPLQVLQEIYAFSEDGKKDLYAYVINKEAKPLITKGRKYEVNLVDREGVSLNKMLVECKMACGKESEKCHLEDKEVRVWADEDSLEEEEEEDEQLNGECLLNNYLNNLSDDVFEDEEGLEFLKEFASKLFPNLDGLVEIPTSAQGEERKEPCAKAEVTETEQNFRRLLELQRKRRSRNRKVLELKSREVLTPQVLWCQTQVEVRFRILLGNVSDYSVECTHSNFSFRCVTGEKFYAVDFRLFGGVNPQLTKVWTKAFHVLVVLRKLAFPMWPRLLLDQGKHRWISVDVEGLKDKEKDFSDEIKRAKAEIDSGRLKKGFRSDAIQPYSDSENSDAEGHSDSEDMDEI